MAKFHLALVFGRVHQLRHGSFLVHGGWEWVWVSGLGGGFFVQPCFCFFLPVALFLLFWGVFGYVKTLEEEIISTSKTFFSVQSKLSCIRYVENVSLLSITVLPLLFLKGL